MRVASLTRSPFSAVLFAALAVTAVVACAQGQNSSDDDDDVRVDARVTATDARPTDARVDAPMATDARIIDAPLPGMDGGLPGLDGGLPGMCTASSQCGSGMCCANSFMICIARPDPPLDVLVCLP